MIEAAEFRIFINIQLKISAMRIGYFADNLNGRFQLVVLSNLKLLLTK
jgi:hypothetical protein